MKFIKLLGRAFLFSFLTLLTQIGGVVYLLSFLVDIALVKFIKKKGFLLGSQFVSFLILYTAATFLIIPPLASSMGRVPLPMSQTENLKPLNKWTCFLNRHYVRPELRDVALHAAKDLNGEYPSSVVSYLDANFPFFNGFPLIPHLSHNDGKKLDLAFCYKDPKTGELKNGSPSWIGYGVCEEPEKGEKNTASECDQKNLMYSLLLKVVPQGNKSDYQFDGERTKELTLFFANSPAIGKIFIEPHLKSRLHLNHDKVRFHGCHAVRHDDHLHVQLY